MTDWLLAPFAGVDWSTGASLATAGGTLVLAVATFASVRSANRAARMAERSFRLGLRPVLAPSRLEDAPQRVMFADLHWVDLKGGRAAVEVIDGVVYLTMLVRNVGNGMATIDGWLPYPGRRSSMDDWSDTSIFRPQTRALWIPPGDVAFWQGALRDPTEPIYGPVVEAIEAGTVSVDLAYRDHEGGQQTVSRFSMVRREVDRPEPGAERGDGDGRHRGGADVEWWVSLAMHHPEGG